MGLDATLIITGIKPADEKYRRMKAVYDACYEADVPTPEAVRLFFGDRQPVPEGVSVALLEMDVGRSPAVTVDAIDGLLVSTHLADDTGLVIDLRKVPEDVKMLRISVGKSW